jgi:hypothetical protein
MDKDTKGSFPLKGGMGRDNSGYKGPPQNKHAGNSSGHKSMTTNASINRPRTGGHGDKKGY